MCSRVEGLLHKHGLSGILTKKSNGAELHDLGGQLILLRREVFFAIKPYSVDLCDMWHRFVETTYSPSRILQ